MVTTKDLYWLAGLFEGEVCFYTGVNGSPGFRLLMTDEDVVRDAHAMVCGGSHGTVKLRPQPTKAGKSVWYFDLGGRDAIAWMFMLFPLMHTRRRAKIRAIVADWKARTAKPNWRHPSRPRPASAHVEVAPYDYAAYYQRNKAKYQEYGRQNREHINELRRTRRKARLVARIKAMLNETTAPESEGKPCL